ncbi:MAG: RHS repeat-associated core domain-containing protein [Verrucomicrobiia bacterium]
MVESAQSCFTFLAADRESAARQPATFGQLLDHRPHPTFTARLPHRPKTRVRGFSGCPSGQTSRRGRGRSINTPGSRACGYKTVSGRHEWLNRDPLGEAGGINLYDYVANNPINLFDPLGLVDCATLASLIANQENNIHGAIRSMSDINQMFNSTMETQDAAVTIEGLEAVLGGGVIKQEIAAYHTAPWTYQEGLKTAVIVGTLATAADETKNRVIGAGVQKLTGLDVFDPANTIAEKQEQMSENMSSSTYQTILGLQSQLASMLDLYNSNCKCKQ